MIKKNPIQPSGTSRYPNAMHINGRLLLVIFMVVSPIILRHLHWTSFHGPSGFRWILLFNGKEVEKGDKPNALLCSSTATYDDMDPTYLLYEETADNGGWKPRQVIRRVMVITDNC